MQLLIVHRDPEMGEALVQMVKSYTRHQCQLVRSDSAAMDWARRHQQCNLLLTQLEAEGIDGLALGSSLSEIIQRSRFCFFQITPRPSNAWKFPRPKFFRSRLRETLCWIRSSGPRARRRMRPIFCMLSMFCRCVVLAGAAARSKWLKNPRVDSCFFATAKSCMPKQPPRAAAMRSSRSQTGSLSNLLTNGVSVLRSRRLPRLGTIY